CIHFINRWCAVWRYLLPYTTLFRAQGAQGDRRTDDLLAVMARQGERLDPVCPEVQGAFAHMVLPAGGDVAGVTGARTAGEDEHEDRKSTRLNSSHVSISYAVFCLKK